MVLFSRFLGSARSYFVLRRFRRYKDVYLSQPVDKDKYTFVHFLKESFYSLINAFSVNPIHNFIILMR